MVALWGGPCVEVKLRVLRARMGSYRNIVFIILLTVRLWGVPEAVEARGIREDFQTWGVIFATGSFAMIDHRWTRFQYSMEAQGRFGNDSSTFSQGIIRPALGYAVTDHTSVWLGGDWVPPSDPFVMNDDFNEYRSWQQVLWSDTFSVGTVTSRGRFEQRFFDRPGTEEVGYRYRHLLKLSIPLPFLNPDVSLILADEIFVNFTHADVIPSRQGLEQNRAIAGFSYRINQTTTVECAYMNQYLSRNNTPQPDQLQHVLLTTILFNF